MIKSIKLSYVATFKSEVNINTNKPVNMFYGINGTGKSTIGRVLNDPVLPKHSSCNIQVVDDSKILVFNHDFIEDNFYACTTQKGIFTIGEQSASDIKELERLEKENVNLAEKMKKANEDKEKLGEDSKKIKEGIEKEIFSSIKATFEKGKLDVCLRGYKADKNKLYNKVASYDLEPISKTAQDIISQYELLGDKDQKGYDEIPEIVDSFSDIINDLVWQEIIVSSKSSYLSNVIDKLDNSQWVRKGITYLDKSNELCPFCQKKFDSNFKSEIENLFDETYTQKETLVNNYISIFKSKIEELEIILRGEADSQGLEKNTFFNSDQTGFIKLSYELTKLISNNLASFEKKLLNLNVPVEVFSITDILEQINNVIRNVNNQISNINKQISERGKTEKQIETDFWKIMRKEYNDNIIKYKEINTRTATGIKEQNKISADLHKEYTENNCKIKEIRARQTSIGKSIDAIKAQIQSIGITGFSIIESTTEQNCYKLQRESQEERIYTTLSEGEKTLISFLYFIELCKGGTDPEAIDNLSEKVIVIDDPISSLSHNYIFEIADIIIRELCNKNKEWDKFIKVKQLFILTHNLYFYHEMRIRFKHYKRRELSDGVSFFRVCKNPNSTIQEIEAEAIQNDYEGYWELLKDAKGNDEINCVLPNIMRNILEHFFSFIYRDTKYTSVIGNLVEESKYSSLKSFSRLIDRESHSDASNICDYKSIDKNLVFDLFKDIFYQAGFDKHYDSMIR